ncbi:hypothetical protein BS78_K154400 [Paspalum vaginatum]|uniref:Uncharacterized protein n=1 Tax=Paspalum vaginatum TaxID=158149 RepID=A0A9W7XBB0_9POAL|nr:hypothetical protein BS78_K154400 [Paspalum vaginatum]
MAIGDPHTRPDAETVFIPNSFGLTSDARDWEACALVPWAMHLPHGAGARDIAELITDELQLHHGDVTVTLHQPEPYLIRFEYAEHAAAARRQGRFTTRGMDICLRPWRSLTHALGFRIFYRVRLCLDGIPSHAWTPEIVERVIGYRCALQCIVTDLVQSADTRHIKLWAWMADPSNIPKRVWLAFTHQPSEASSSVNVFTEKPDPWHQGARYEVFLHMPLIEDYTAAARNLQAAIDNPASIAPIRRRYDWRYGLIDGSPPEALSGFPARLPRPPLDKEGRDNQRGTSRATRGKLRGGDRGGRGTSRDTRDEHHGGDRGSGDGHGHGGRGGGGCGGHERDGYGPDRDNGQGRGGGGRDARSYADGRDSRAGREDRAHGSRVARNGRAHDERNGRDAGAWQGARDARPRGARPANRDEGRGRNKTWVQKLSCKGAAFTWPLGRHDDDEDDHDDDYDHPGQGDKSSDSFWGLNFEGLFRRERTRSPPRRRDYTPQQGHRHDEATAAVELKARFAAAL